MSFCIQRIRQGRPSPNSQLCILHIPPISQKIINVPPNFAKFIHTPFSFNLAFCLIYLFFTYLNILTMMHLCIMLYTNCICPPVVSTIRQSKLISVNVCVFVTAWVGVFSDVCFECHLIGLPLALIAVCALVVVCYSWRMPNRRCNLMEISSSNLVCCRLLSSALDRSRLLASILALFFGLGR